jgi:hypothetical protein
MLLVDVLMWLTLFMADTPEKAPTASAGPASVEFQRDVRPILEQHCQPCHFAGGKVYEHLPFDKAETIDKLGTKLFTRIKKESEQKVIRAYLERAEAASRPEQTHR